MSYSAPIKDMLFVMQDLAGLEEIATLPGFEDAIAGKSIGRFCQSIGQPCQPFH